MARRNVGAYRVGQQVQVVGREGPWIIAGFPSRRLVVIRCAEGSGPNSVTTVSIHDLTALPPTAGGRP